MYGNILISILITLALITYNINLLYVYTYPLNTGSTVGVLLYNETADMFKLYHRPGNVCDGIYSCEQLQCELLTSEINKDVIWTATLQYLNKSDLFQTSCGKTNWISEFPHLFVKFIVVWILSIITMLMYYIIIVIAVIYNMDNIISKRIHSYLYILLLILRVPILIGSYMIYNQKNFYIDKLPGVIESTNIYTLVFLFLAFIVDTICLPWVVSN